jgi:hypothetical protein
LNHDKPQRPAVYPRLLGPAWHELADAIQQLHDGTRIVRANGTFRVRHVRPILAWLARLPAAGEMVALRLVITPTDAGEEWHRTFAGNPMVSQQWARPDGLLAERIGGLELRFRLTGEQGALFYRSVSAALRLGPLRLPLPHGSSAWVTAWERSGVRPRQLEVHVEVRMPVVGVVVVYEGPLEIEETP